METITNEHKKIVENRPPVKKANIQIELWPEAEAKLELLKQIFLLDAVTLQQFKEILAHSNLGLSIDQWVAKLINECWIGDVEAEHITHSAIKGICAKCDSIMAPGKTCACGSIQIKQYKMEEDKA